ncbi:hypothetical protein [Vibrio anguillarum]|uniref:hypothetical protein n=2 Tax=Vibrio anguillarum TaxID=55601 RepID=UPI001F243055|nr:hypothetical protein [Vibrio anguillarum]
MKNNKEKIIKFLESKNNIKSSNNLNEQIISKEKLCVREKEQVNNKLKIKKELKRGNKEPSQKLKDKIEGHQLKIDDLESEISKIKSQFLKYVDISKGTISELRKIDPKKANELEYSLSLKKHIN